MITFNVSHAGKHFGQVREQALSEPVGIKRHGRVNVIVLSVKEYERREALDQRRALAAAEISEADAERLDHTDMDRRHANLDRLMDE